MIINISATLTIAILMLALGGCTASFTTNTNKPANAPSNAASNSNSNSASNGTAAKKPSDAKPTEKLANEKKPEGKGKTANAKVPVPENWIFVYDDQKGYSFYVPEGTTGGAETVNGVSVFSAATPAPSEVDVMVIAYKNEKLTKDDLLNDAVKVLEAAGEKVTAGKLTAEGENYSLAEATSTSADGKKSKYKILVGTDVTDNYVMILGTEESKFSANEKVIDEIWGNFEMWSHS